MTKRTTKTSPKAAHRSEPNATPVECLRASYLSSLGPALKPDELASALKRIPVVTREQLALSGEERIELGEELQEQVVIPHPAAIDVYHSVRSALVRRYKAITDNESRLLRQLHGMETGTIPGLVSTSLIRPSASIGLLGPTGIGKSTLLEGIARLFPDTVRHPDILPGTEVVQVPIIYVALTGDATVKNLLIRIIEAVDRRMGTDINTRRIINGRPSADTLKLLVQQCCVRYGVGIIYIDEMQNLTSSRAGGAELVTNELLFLRDALGIPLVFSGTYRMMSLLSSDARMTRRVSQNGLFSMAYATRADDFYWQQMCEARWKSLVVRKPARLTAEIKSALFQCTQGMTWALPAILCKVQREVILSEAETVDAESIMQTFAERAMEMHDLVRAMASRDATLLSQYEDLYHPAFDSLQAEKRHEEFERLRLIGSSRCPEAEGQAANPPRVVRQQPRRRAASAVKARRKA